MAGRLGFFGGYRFSTKENKPTACVLIYKHCNYDMPRKFTWHSSNDIDNFKLYVGALHNRDQMTIQKYEDGGAAYDLDYEVPPQAEEIPIITISKERLLNLIRGEERLTCRADTRLTLTTNARSRSFIIRDFVAYMIAEKVFDEEHYGDLLVEGEKALSYHAPNHKLEQAGVGPHDFHTGVNVREELRDVQYMRSVGDAPAKPVESDKEVIIKTEYRGSYVEQLSMAVTDGATYYIKRLIHKGAAIYAATSSSLKNGWKVYHRDAARLLALNIKE